MESQTIRKCVAEAFGTFVMVVCGCGTAALAGTTVGDVGIALAFGLSVVCVFYAIGNVSGCHLNPAVTLAVRMTRGISTSEMISYWISQFLGAFLGAAIVLFFEFSCSISPLVQGLSCNGFGMNSTLGLNMNGAVIVEMFLTCFFVMTFLGVTSKKKMKSVAGLAIGLALVAVHLIGINLTGTSVNPARSFGPALMMCIAGDITPLCQVWVFIVAPMLGGALGAVLFKVITGKTKSKEVPIDEY